MSMSSTDGNEPTPPAGQPSPPTKEDLTTGVTPKKTNHSRPPLSPSNTCLTHSSAPTRTLSHDAYSDNTRRRRITTTGASYLRSMSTSILGGPRRKLPNEHLSAVPALDNRSVEEKRLNRIVTETGEDAWGIDAVEVWLLESNQSGRLVRLNGGYWRNPDMQLDEFLSRIEDSSNPMYVSAEPVLVGVDLPGNLWMEVSEGIHGIGGNHHDGILNLSRRGGNLFGHLNSRPPTPSGSSQGGNFFGNRQRMGSFDSSNSGKGGKVFSGGSLKGGDVFAALSHAMGKASTGSEKENDPHPINRNDGDKKDGADNEGENQSITGCTSSNPTKPKKKPTHRRSSTWGSLSRSFDPRNKLRLPKFGQHKGSADQDNQNHLHSPQALLNWRDISSLVDDPDTAKTPRLNAIHNAGFNHAAGVTFSAGYQRGMVIFLTQLEEDAEQLIDYYNQSCMVRNAEAIGSVIAANEARKAAMVVRPDGSMSADTGAATDGKDDIQPDNFWNNAKRRMTTWSRKCIGGGSLQVPPAVTWNQSIFSFSGCLCTLLLLGSVSEAIHSKSDGDLFFFMAPIGALMALEFGLTAAPASQPRSAFYGQAVSGAISLAFTYIPMAVWLRQAIASSLAIAMMGKLGVLHPPAGAASILLASGQFGWRHYGLLLAATMLSLIPAVLINNSSTKRQYPTHSWKAMFLCRQ